ncbi:MAG: hypothetical protein WD712_00395 [Candidatus Spechtbacterales bacterium]
MLLQTWADVFVLSMQDLWTQLVEFLPTILGALAVLIVGWVFAVVLGKAVVRLARALQVDKFVSKTGIMEQLHKMGLEWEVSSFLGGLVRWFFIIVAFLAAVDLLGLQQLSAYIRDILLYIPNIVVAALILLVAAVLASFLDRLMKASVRAAGIGPEKFVSAMTRWSVWGFAGLAALSQLKIASAFVETLFMGLVAMLAIAGGLAFGLGGQGVARDLLERLRGDLSEK